MSVFMIETGNVDSASSAMEKIASQLSDLSSSVSGYSLYGFANSASTNTRLYSTVALLATTSNTTSYVILYKNVTATYYYNSNTVLL